MDRTKLLNLLIDRHNYSHFFEIGVRKGGNFDKIKAREKLGVDPHLSGYPLSLLERVSKKFYNLLRYRGKNVFKKTQHEMLVEMTSDQAFIKKQKPFFDRLLKTEIAFIDGSHFYEDVIRDVIHSNEIVSDRGCILLHDCLPQTAAACSRTRTTSVWNGDVWKAIFWLDKRGVDLVIFDFDHGVGCIKKQPSSRLTYLSASEKTEIDGLSFDDFCVFRKRLDIVAEASVEDRLGQFFDQ